MKKKVMVLILSLFLGMFLFGSVSAYTYYVSPTGNNSESGNSTNPWETLFYAESVATAGSIIILKDGTYYINDDQISNGALYFYKNLSLIAENNLQATIYLNSSSASVGVIYWNAIGGMIDGVVLDCGVAPSKIGVYIRYSADDFYIQNSKIMNCGIGITTSTDATGSVNNLNIINNSIYNISAYGVSLLNTSNTNITIINNTVYDASYSFRIDLNNDYTFLGNKVFSDENNSQFGLYLGNVSGKFKTLDNTNFQCGNETNHYPGRCIVFSSSKDNITISDMSFFIRGGGVYTAAGVYANGNLTNFIFVNNTFCSSNNPCSSNSALLYGVWLTREYNNNILMNTNSLYFDNASYAIKIGGGSNLTIENNYFFVNNSQGLAISNNANEDTTGIVVRNNTFEGKSHAPAHTLMIGTEGDVVHRINGALIENNILNMTPKPIHEGILHSMLIGHTNNSIIRNNIVYGGNYNYVIKGNYNINFTNNTGYYAPEGLLIKSDDGGIFSRNKIYMNSYSSVGFDIRYNDVGPRYVINTTFLDCSIIDDGHYGIESKVSDNSSVTYVNVSYNLSNSRVLDNSNLTTKWYLDASSNVLNTNITITNSSGGIFYSDLVRDIPQQTLLSNVKYGGAQINYSNYTISASASGYITNTSTFSLTENKDFAFVLVAAPITTGNVLLTPSGSGFPTYYPTESKLQKGYSKVLGKNWKVMFHFENETHGLKVDNIKNNSVTITVSSNPITFNLSINETKKIDIDNNGIYDLSILLKNITTGAYYHRAEVYIKSINEEIPINQQNTAKEHNQNKSFNPQEDKQARWIKNIISENIKSDKFIYVAMGVILIAIVIALLVLKFRAKKKKG